MTFENIMELFKEYFEIDKNIEVMKLKHGYYIFVWDDKKQAYYSNKQLIQSPQRLFDELYSEAEVYYKTLLNNTTDDNIKSFVYDKLNMLKQKFHALK